MKAKLWLIAPALLLAGGCVFRFALTAHDFIGYGLFFAAAVVIAYHFFSPRLRKILTVLLILGVLGFAAVETPILAGAHTDAAEETDYIIVLGAGLHGDVPSLSLTDRLSAALDYTEAHPQAMVIVSGGQGAGENMTEAEAMAIWLEARGLDASRILREDRAASTEQNLEYSFALIRERGDDPEGCAVVTAEYHLYRARLMARDMGVAVQGVAAHTSWPTLMVNYFLREAFAVVYYWIFR